MTSPSPDQRPDPGLNQNGPRPGDRASRFWRNVGITVTVILVLGGLAMVAAAVIFVVGINMWAANK